VLNARIPLGVLALMLVAVSAWAQPPSTRVPRFEDFPVTETWNGIAAPVKLATPSDRMFRTRLTGASKQPPNVAGHYRFAIWGCGSECISGALVDLQTGRVFSPPLATSTARFSVCQNAYENSGVEYRVDSRLVIVRCGLNYSERLQKNVPDTYYFLWQQNSFRQLLQISGKRAGR
jgi:hypothetical protein